MIIEIKKYTGGKVAASRKSAVKIIKQKEINYFDDDIVVFDFDGIEVASHNFVDELIGNYIEKLGKIPDNIEFKNTNNFVKEQIKFVITERLKKVKNLSK